MRKILVSILILVMLLGTANAYNSTQTKLVGITHFDNKTKGVLATLTVEVHNGSGRVFVETNPLTKIDTQVSARLAKEVACEITGVNCSNYDFYYIINSDYEIVGGPSAGAAMTVATIAALQGVKLKGDVFITGTINPAGSIGPVGGILDKAEAAYLGGAKTLLVPHGETIYYDEATGKEVNLSYLAMKNWGVRLLEVNDIYQAYPYLTGYKLEIKNISSTDVASKEFDDVMHYLSKYLIKYSTTLYSDADGKVNSSYLSQEDTDSIRELLSEAKGNIVKAENAENDGNYYSASSFSVRSLLYSNYAIYLVGYSESGKNKTYVQDKINNVNKSISSFEVMFLKKRKIDDYRDLEIYSVVIDRLREAQELIKKSNDAYNEGDYERALYLASFAEIRKNTAYDWLILVSKFNSNLSLMFDFDNLKGISRERIQEVKTLVTYASVVANNQILDVAKTHLESAIAAYNRGDFVFSLFEAAKARAEANLAMEGRGLTNDTVQSKIDDLERMALISIKNAEDMGYLPILALSYFEFGKTLRSSSPLQSLIYLSYSREMVQISKDLSYAITGNHSQIFPKNQVVLKQFGENKYLDEVIGKINILILGTLFGVLLAIYLTENRR
jgi:uncharacterized protein